MKFEIKFHRRPFSVIGRTAALFRRLVLSFSLMTRLEHILALIFFSLALILLAARAYAGYKAETQLVPASGGEYKEAAVGEIKYLNPVLAQTGADKAAADLIFSGLVKVQKSGVNPNVAERWEVTADGLKYTFHLRKNVLFHDGAKLTANDVAFTIESIKAYETKSPLYDAWRDIRVTVEDDYTVVFELPRPYGPFIFNCNFGIVPSHLSSDDLAKRFIGSGPYRFIESRTSDRKTTEINLARNDNYYLGAPYIAKIKLGFFDSADKAVEAFTKNKYDGLFGAEAKRQDSNDFSYETSKRLGLIFNLRNERLKDKEFRRKVIEGLDFPERTKLRLVALDMAPQRAEAEELKSNLARKNLDLEVIYLNASQLKDVLDSKEFEVLLYGFDFGYHRDSYAFWHSSQLDKRNYAGLSDKDSDILLEDARMMLDGVERNKKYDEFFGKLASEYLVQFYKPMRYNFYLDTKVWGAKPVDGVETSSHFDSIAGWYVKEKRVRKQG